MADPLGKLVHLTRLYLRGTWHEGVGCVSRVCMHAVPCARVRRRLWQREAVWLMWRGWGVCRHQAMRCVTRGQQQHWRSHWASWCT